MNFKKVKFNCSGLPTLMGSDVKPLTDKQKVELEGLAKREKLTPNQSNKYEYLLSKVDDKVRQHYLTDNAKKYLKEVYVKEKYKKNIVNPTKDYSIGLINGTLSQNKSLELISSVYGEEYSVYEDIIQNSILKGKIDAYKGASIKRCQKVIEVKTASSMQSLMASVYEKQDLIDKYYWQLMGYLSITKCDEAEIYHVLVTYDESIILETINRFKQKIKGISMPKEYIAYQIQQIRNNLSFDDIPKNERIIKVSINRDDEKILMIHEKVKASREYLKEFEKLHYSLIK